MVLPKLPFSLFDFSRIEFWGTKYFTASAAAGDAIAKTLYTVKPFKFVLVLNATLYTAKVTGTAMKLAIMRHTSEGDWPCDWLIAEDSENQEWFAWPPGKTPTLPKTPGWHLIFMYPGDYIYYTHALTAAETIEDTINMGMIEYSDPRYEE